MKLNSFFLLISIIYCLNAAGQGMEFNWVKGIAGNSGLAEGLDVHTDVFGYVYTVGRFSGKRDFDPGLDTFFLTSQGSQDMFIQKLDPNGSFVWVKSIGRSKLVSANGAKANAVTSDSLGNTYTTGIFKSLVDFDPGVDSFMMRGSSSGGAFILKLDSSGGFKWAKSIGGIIGFNQGLSIDIDNQSNIYTTGLFEYKVDFDPGPDTNFLTGKGLLDIFIQKLDSGGNLIWAKAMGSFGRDAAYSIKIDHPSEFHITGQFQGTVDFDPDTGVSNLSSKGYLDAFVAKFDTAGEFKWAKSFGSRTADVGTAVTNDIDGAVYVVGSCFGDVDFDPSPAVADTFWSRGGEDIYVLKLDSNGGFVWVNRPVGVASANDRATSIAIDKFDNVLVTGWYNGKRDFNATADTNFLISKGNTDIFLLNLKRNGSFKRVLSIGSAARNSGNSLIFDNHSNLYMTGIFNGHVDFNPFIGVSQLNSSNSAFLVKFSPCSYKTSIDTIVACDSYTWINGVTYTSSDTIAKDTLLASNGCDSIVSLYLTINYTRTSIDSIVACDSYTWINGVTYTSSDTIAKDTLLGLNGCDSVVSLKLTINYSSSGIDSISACDSLTWIDGVTYYANNNTATHTLAGYNGCDSLVRLVLTITSIDASVTIIDQTLTSNEAGAIYKWLDCNNNNAIISGETAQNFTASRNGKYAVEVSRNGCTSTSLCYEISTVGIEQNNLFKNVSVYPNPSSGKVFIDLGDIEKATMRIFDVKGAIVLKEEITSKGLSEIEIGQKGSYLLILNSDEVKKSFNIVVQ